MDENMIMADDKLEAELKVLRSKEKIFTTLIYITMVSIFLFAIIGIIPISLISLVLAIVFIAMTNDIRGKIQNLLNENIINAVLKEALGDTVEYRPWEKITPGSMMLPFPYSLENGSQHIKGVCNGMNIELGNITFLNEEEHQNQDGTYTAKVPQFKGQWLICDLGRELPCDVFISEVNKNDCKSMEGNVTSGNELFDNRFRVKADDPQTAHRILTPQMMEYISVMADKLGCPVYLSFLRSGKLNVAVKTEREIFEFGNGKADLEALRRKFISELHGVIDVIDMLHLKEINL